MSTVINITSDVPALPDPALRKTVSALSLDADAERQVLKVLEAMGVCGVELDALLDRAELRDIGTNFCRHAFRDGFPSGLVTLALNLWGFERFEDWTGDTTAAAALYGTSLGSAIVVLDALFHRMFEGMTYVPANVATPVAATPYYAATTLPLTLRNMVRALAAMTAAMAARPDLIPAIDNGIEVGGGILATMATGSAMQQLAQAPRDDQVRGMLERPDLAVLIQQLRQGHARHAGRAAAQACLAALRGVLDVPSALLKLTTPVGVATVATLTLGVPAALAAMAASRDAIDGDAPAAREAAAGAVRVAVLFSAYVLLAAASRHADTACSHMAAALKRVGEPLHTAASHMATACFTTLRRGYRMSPARRN